MEKTVLLIRNVRPDMYGGGETYQLLLAEELKENGFLPVIVTSSDALLKNARKKGFMAVEAPFCSRQNWSGIRNILLPEYVVWQMKLKRWYNKLFKEYKPSVVNIQSRDDWIAATTAAEKMGVRVLWTDHMDFRSWVLVNVDKKYKNTIGKWILKCARNAYRIIMIADSEERFLKHIDMSRELKNVTVIKNGVKDKRAKYAKKPKSGSFCYVGRIIDYKGVKELINAFKEVEERHNDVTLDIYGSGDADYVKECMKMAEGCKGIRFCGYTDEPLKVMAENEIFVLPSYIEGLSLSLLDAAMMGKKIIASDVGGNSEVIEDGKTGVLISPRSVVELEKAMMWMLDNKEKADIMAKNARDKYLENYNFDEIFAKQMLPLYNVEKEKK